MKQILLLSTKFQSKTDVLNHITILLNFIIFNWYSWGNSYTYNLSPLYQSIPSPKKKEKQMHSL